MEGYWLKLLFPRANRNLSNIEASHKLQTFSYETRYLNIPKIKTLQYIFVIPQRGQHCALHVVGIKRLKIYYFWIYYLWYVNGLLIH